MNISNRQRAHLQIGKIKSRFEFGQIYCGRTVPSQEPKIPPRKSPCTIYNICVVYCADSLYADKLQPDSSARLKKKLVKLKLPVETVKRRLEDLQENQRYHASAVQKVIDEQMETTVAKQMNAGGGGRTVLNSVLAVLLRVCRP